MSSTLSKRHQARNERALQELIKTVPGNERCADCQVRNPGWASWNLGIFLCMRCASLHRKLGTHISKVKSLSMDSWPNEQVENMKKYGNVTSNKLYNPKNVKPSVPLDVDEIDAAMERYIRQKYDKRTLSGETVQKPMRQEIASPRSSDEQPPPLPPKTEKRYNLGLRSASSALPLSRHDMDSLPPSPDRSTRISAVPSPIRVNKQSRIFGASVGVSEDGSEWKLVTLREMGFPDDKRNSNILKGLGGDLDRTVESLVRLGEGNHHTAKLKSPTRAWPADSFPEPRTSSNSQYQVPAPSSRLSTGQQTTQDLGNNSQVQHQITGASESRGSSQQQSYNPFDTGNLYSAPLQPPLETMFQSMHLSQPLFPNATGGYPSQQQQLQQSRIQQSNTPVPQIPQQYHHTNPFAPQPTHSYNPFMNTNEQTNMPISTNPYQPPLQSPIPQNIHQPQTPLNPYESQSSVSGSSSSTPFSFAQNNAGNQHLQSSWSQIQSPQETQQPQYFPDQGQYSVGQYQNTQFSPHQESQSVLAMQSILPQNTGRFDKNSILALYNYPQLAPPPLPSSQSPIEPAPTIRQSPAKLPPSVGFTHGQRSVTMPALSAGSKNPFLSSGAPSTSATPFQTSGNSRYVSEKESGGLNSGRHSPDAFANLSARYVR